MFQQSTLDQLLKIAQQLTGRRGLFVPGGPTSPVSGKNADGPHWVIAATIYEGLFECEWLPIEGADFVVRFEGAAVTEFSSSRKCCARSERGDRRFGTCVIAGAIPRARYSRARVRVGMDRKR